MTIYVVCDYSRPTNQYDNYIQTSPLIMVTITLMNGTVLNNVNVNPDGSVWVNNNKILDNSPMLISTSNGTNCSAFFATMQTITISYNVIASIFSQVDPVFFSIYKMMNGEGSRGDTNRTTFSNNASYELQQFYNEMNSTIRNITVKLYDYLEGFDNLDSI